MYVLFVVLNETEYLRSVLDAFKKTGIRGATVIDSIGAGQIAKSDLFDVPLVGGLMNTLDSDSSYNKTIFSVIEKEEQVEKVMDAIEEALGGDMRKPGSGIMFCLPVVKIRGGELERHIEKRKNKEVIEKEYKSEYY
ncbi:MAG: P-II family nitrogen regulator [Clostridia bacterium]|nr:P-II family nitrogen regulator [Clostridia bacterium]